MASPSNHTLDLVGEPFAVIESDPGLFSTFIRDLGVKGLQVTELYDIEPWATAHLDPKGLIFCFLWQKDVQKPGDFDPDGERVWFANQLSDDACASLAILNVLFNNPSIDLGERLGEFREETALMSSEMKGLAISNCHFLRHAQNSLARPADMRGSVNAIAKTTIELSKQSAKPPPAKRRKTAAPTRKAKAPIKQVDSQESFHFIGYVPCEGKIWELDGLKSGPLEVGEIPPVSEGTWMDVVRPALRRKMEKFGGGGGAGDIRFNLLAIVPDQYLKVSDQLELLKRERSAIERRLTEEFSDAWSDQVDATLLESANEVFATSASQSSAHGATYAADFGSMKMEITMRVMEMPSRNLARAWERCIQGAMSAKVAVEEELGKPRDAHTDRVKRTFDYEPLINEFVAACHREGILDTVFRSRKQSSTKS